MISRPGWIVLIALAGLAQATPAAADYTLADVMVSSVREGRVVARGRTDARGDFRLHLPAGPSGADEICLNGRSARLAIARAGPGPGAGDRRRAGTLVELRVATLNRRVREMNDPPQIHQQRLVVPASRVRAGRQAGSADLCFRPFAGLAEGQRPGIGPATTRRGASGPRTPLPGSGGAARAATSEPVYVRNADGTYSILELLQTNPPSDPSGPATPQVGRGGIAEITLDQSPDAESRTNPPLPGADHTGDAARREWEGERLRERIRPDEGVRGSAQRVDPRIPPPGGRSRRDGSPAPRPTLVIGSIRVVNWP